MAVGQGKRQFGKLFGEAPGPPGRGQGRGRPRPPAGQPPPVVAAPGADVIGRGPAVGRGLGFLGRGCVVGRGASGGTADRGTSGTGASVGWGKGSTGASRAADDRPLRAGRARDEPEHATGPQATPSGVLERRRPASACGQPAAARQLAPVAESLAIPGYDTLAASQVVQRLSSLRPDELEAIRRYELSTRGRRTILHRVAQLAADR